VTFLLRYVGFDPGGVGADAGVADRGVHFVDFLHHRSDETGELWYLAPEDCLAEIDVAENAIVDPCACGTARPRKTCQSFATSGRPPQLRGLPCFNALEVVEERAFGDARLAAKVIHGR
jgi:hypothetical protein